MPRKQSGGLATATIESALARAAEHEALGAFWALDPGGALEQAAELDRGGSPVELPLAGRVVAVKDLYDMAGLPTTAGLPGRRMVARSDAGLVRRLRAAGAVPVGKTAMDPLGLTTSGQAPGFPPCMNPVDRSLSPGGSSSGSAAAVAAGIADIGLASDTAGSVRIPAAYCGVAALKPALGRLRRGGMLPVMGQWDVPGVIAPTIAECIAAYEILVGSPVPSAAARHLRVGVLSDLMSASDPAVAASCERALARLGCGGIELQPVELGWGAKGYGLVLACEFESAWGREVDAEPDAFPGLASEMVASAREAGPEGFAAVSASIDRERALIERRLGGFDAFISPTTPVPAPDRDDERVAVSTRFARVFSALGWPAATLPAPAVDGRPVGIQVSARPVRFGELLEVAALCEGGAAAGKPSSRRA